jgi:hypothetical protein
MRLLERLGRRNAGRVDPHRDGPASAAIPAAAILPERALLDFIKKLLGDCRESAARIGEKRRGCSNVRPLSRGWSIV